METACMTVKWHFHKHTELSYDQSTTSTPTMWIKITHKIHKTTSRDTSGTQTCSSANLKFPNTNFWISLPTITSPQKAILMTDYDRNEWHRYKWGIKLHNSELVTEIYMKIYSINGKYDDLNKHHSFIYYRLLVKPILEINNIIWQPHFKSIDAKIKTVQRWATKNDP